MAWVPYANAQAIEVLVVAKCRYDVAQSVVPAMPATVLEFCNASGEVQFVMGNQDFFRFNFIKARNGRYGLAAAVHERGGN